MRVRASTILGDAWAAWRADWRVLTAVAGVCQFLPQLALLLLVPTFPDLSAVTSTDPADPTFRAASEAIATWLTRYGGWYLIVALLAAFAQFAIIAWYLTPRRSSAGIAIGAAAALSPRLFAASILWGAPLALSGAVLVLTGLSVAIFPVMAVVMARLALTSAAIVAEPPTGPIGAIRRSVTATRGATLMLATVILGVVVAQYCVVIPFSLFDAWLLAHGPNPVVRSMVDACQTGATTLGLIAMALIQVAAWRRLKQR